MKLNFIWICVLLMIVSCSEDKKQESTSNNQDTTDKQISKIVLTSLDTTGLTELAISGVKKKHFNGKIKTERTF